ncbi:MAG: NAD-dependent DNA ligase LigA [Bacilli bacterium]|nr:NAD-dependent DNA ligase LigA [Bacilli bacterium]
MEKIKRIQTLVNQLNIACDAYYNLNKPIMENREYNLLFDELEALEQQTGVILSDSPTQRAGYPVVSDLPKIKHEIPLLSLDKIKFKEMHKLVKWLGDKQGVLMLKMDGGTGAVHYKKSFKQLVTRGDSETNIGEDISHNVHSIKNIPLSIDDTDEVTVVGENFMRYSSFNEINAKILNPDDRYANPRNLANGSVGLLDSKVCKERNVEFCAFNIIKGNKFKTKQEQLEWLKSQGFYVVQYWMVTKDNLEETINQIVEDIPTYDTPIDGLVLTYDDIEYGLSLGKTNHHYNFSVSLKFEDDWYKTKYLYTEWNTSRFGKIIGTGVFQSVNIEGSEVSRATTHNLNRFWNLKLGKDDIIEVTKRHKIIPAIENNITRSNTEQIPIKCPACGGEVEVRLVVNTHDLFCLNPDCEAKLTQKLKHFVSKQCFNISDLGEATLETFIENGFIENYMDIFKLERFKKEIVKLNGFGLKSFNNLMKALENAKQITMSSLIASLGIKNVGFGSAKRLTKHFNNNINVFLEATKSYSNFIRIEDFGEVTANSICDYFQGEENMKMFLELLECVNITKEEKREETGMNSLEGKTFVVTGKVNTFRNRDEVGELITSLGGKLATSVSKNTSYLLNNDITSITGKNKKALELGIPIISEIEFNLMVGRIV